MTNSVSAGAPVKVTGTGGNLPIRARILRNHRGAAFGAELRNARNRNIRLSGFPLFIVDLADAGFDFIARARLPRYPLADELDRLRIALAFREAPIAGVQNPAVYAASRLRARLERFSKAAYEAYIVPKLRSIQRTGSRVWAELAYTRAGWPSNLAPIT